MTKIFYGHVLIFLENMDNISITKQCQHERFD